MTYYSVVEIGLTGTADAAHHFAVHSGLAQTGIAATLGGTHSVNRKATLQSARLHTVVCTCAWQIMLCYALQASYVIACISCRGRTSSRPCKAYPIMERVFLVMASVTAL